MLVDYEIQNTIFLSLSKKSFWHFEHCSHINPERTNRLQWESESLERLIE